MRDWHSTVALVTGGGSGIGRALARRAGAEGAAVAVVDIDASRAAIVAEEITAAGGTARSYGCDIADASAVADLAAQVQAELGNVNYLFNNAGICTGSTLEKTRLADARWLFEVNVLGTLSCTQAILPQLRAAAASGHTAHIITTGSENSLGLPVLGPTSVYTATKHAVLGLMDALRRDLKDSGIKVSLLCPGLVRTDLLDSKRLRPAAYGGPEHASPEQRARVDAFMAAQGQDPDLTARLCFEGIARGDFIIPTDPKIRDFAQRRHQEVETALDVLDASLAAL